MEIVIGCKLWVKKAMEGGKEKCKAEIIAIKEDHDGKKKYYVHYIDYNKRLDEWVEQDKLIYETLEPPVLKVKKKLIINNPKTQKKINLNEYRNKLDDSIVEESHLKSSRGRGMIAKPEVLSTVKNISQIEIGQYIIEAWYFSPYPNSIIKNGKVFICETCLEALSCSLSLERHRKKCNIFVPPGIEIYRSNNLSLFEIDGHKQPIWCRNLCLLAKLFLDHKTLYYDVEPFLFYPLLTFDERGAHIVGYFSKEKKSAENYNVACILTLPHHQKKGYGRLLIGLSYQISKILGIPGSPEKPLSDLGLLSYRSYWTEEVLKILIEVDGPISIDQISEKTAIAKNDILHTLHFLQMLKYYKGQHIIVITKNAIKIFEKIIKKPQIKIEDEKFKWKEPSFSTHELNFI